MPQMSGVVAEMGGFCPSRHLSGGRANVRRGRGGFCSGGRMSYLRCKLPQRSPGRAPAAIAASACKTHLVAAFLILCSALK